MLASGDARPEALDALFEPIFRELITEVGDEVRDVAPRNRPAARRREDAFECTPLVLVEDAIGTRYDVRALDDALEQRRA